MSDYHVTRVSYKAIREAIESKDHIAAVKGDREDTTVGLYVDRGMCGGFVFLASFLGADGMERHEMKSFGSWDDAEISAEMFVAYFNGRVGRVHGLRLRLTEEEE